ncbi:hypothetical protein [Bacillus mycoides]|uniref:Uncharacterized protein n=1 Tax=Bacillus mycoides TaxID=1405 RepID=A0ABC9QV16_BACMY|nr:hypothetical protein [Bacillus mycoides]EJR28757.1 hypothetical protein III_06094 [Bacillus mycoides]
METSTHDDKLKSDYAKEYKSAFKKLIKFKDVKKRYNLFLEEENTNNVNSIKEHYQKFQDLLKKEFPSFEDYLTALDPTVDIDKPFQHADILWVFIDSYFIHKCIQQKIEEIKAFISEHKKKDTEKFESFIAAVREDDSNEAQKIQIQLSALQYTYNLEILTLTTELILITVEELRSNRKILNTHLTEKISSTHTNNIGDLENNLPDSKFFFITRSNEFNETFKQSYMSKKNALIADGWGVVPEVSVGNKGTGKLSVNLSNAQVFVDNELESIRKKMNPSQLKIVNFIEMRANKEKNIFLNLNIDDFFSLTEQKRRPEVVRSFIENVEIISKFTMRMPTKFNNQYKIIESNYLDFKGIIYADNDEATLSIRKGRKIVGVRVILEEWCKHTNENQVKYIPTEYWKLKKQNAIIFCDKLTQIMRISQYDNKRRKCVETNKHLYKVPVKTLVDMMESDFKTIESKGYSWLEKQLREAFDELENLGFTFNFNAYNFDSFEELISTNIEFTNEKLTQSYIESL